VAEEWVAVAAEWIAVAAAEEWVAVVVGGGGSRSRWR